MTSGYMIAGYLLTWGAMAAYLWRLSVRSQHTQRALDAERATLD